LMRANPICRPPARWNASRPRAERHGPQPVSVSRANFSFCSFFYFLIGFLAYLLILFGFFCYLRFSSFAGGFMNFFEHKLFKFEKTKNQICLNSKFVQVGIFFKFKICSYFGCLLIFESRRYLKILNLNFVKTLNLFEFKICSYIQILIIIEFYSNSKFV
jgi:hypothetical protein